MAWRVPIADDEPNIVTSLEFLRGRRGYEIAVAHDRAHALALVKTFRPDPIERVERLLAGPGPGPA